MVYAVDFFYQKCPGGSLLILDVCLMSIWGFFACIMFYKNIHVWAIVFSLGQPASSRENIPCQKECIKLWCNDLMYLFPIKAHKQSTLRNIWPIRVTSYHQCHVVYVYLYSISVLIWAWSWYQSSLWNIESVILSWNTFIFILYCPC